MIDTVGLPTRCGSAVFENRPPATADAEVVARLRAAGAVIVAKTHTHEFGYGPTGDIAATGPARNPHEPNRITGGSSSGSAAAVAAGHLPLALGSDTGGSVRVPAALCGVVGLKPALGALPTTGVFPLAETCDTVGVIATDTYSTSLAWDALNRPEHVAAPGLDQMSRDVTGLVVGRPVDDYWRAHDDVIAAGVDAATDALAVAGAKVVRVSTPAIDELAATFRTIIDAEVHATHAHWLSQHAGDYQPTTEKRLRTAARVTAPQYISAQRTRRTLAAVLRDQLAEVDILLLPTTPVRATPIGEDLIQRSHVITALLSLTLPFNLTGWASIAVPAGPTADGELPAGVQLVAVNCGEADILRAAATIEHSLSAV